MVKKTAFETFSADDLLREWHWKGNPLSPEAISTLQSEAEAFKGSLLWKVLKAELQWFALKSLLERGSDAEDIRIARIFGNIVQVVETKLDTMHK